jgi:hypothetical protein
MCLHNNTDLPSNEHKSPAHPSEGHYAGEEADEDIGVQAPLVRLVDDDARVLPQQEVGLRKSFQVLGF